MIFCIFGTSLSIANSSSVHPMHFPFPQSTQSTPPVGWSASSQHQGSVQSSHVAAFTKLGISVCQSCTSSNIPLADWVGCDEDLISVSSAPLLPAPEPEPELPDPAEPHLPVLQPMVDPSAFGPPLGLSTVGPSPFGGSIDVPENPAPPAQLPETPFGFMGNATEWVPSQ